MDDVRAWQQRPLDDVYPVVFLDCLVLKIRDGGSVQRRACYLAMAINMDGDRVVLGMWFQETEGAKFWMAVLNELRHRGVRDILICCVDGLKGFPEAIEAVFPQTTVQTCIVHLIRASLRYVPRRQYEPVIKDLKPIYTASNPDTALLALDAFEEKWGQLLPPVVQAWREAWDYVIPFMAYPDEVRRVDLHDKCHRSVEPAAQKSGQDEGQLPVRGRRPQAALPRDPQRRAAMDKDPRVDESVTRVQDPIRRPPTRLTHQTRLHRKSDALATVSPEVWAPVVPLDFLAGLIYTAATDVGASEGFLVGLAFRFGAATDRRRGCAAARPGGVGESGCCVGLLSGAVVRGCSDGGFDRVCGWELVFSLQRRGGGPGAGTGGGDLGDS